MEGGGIGYDSTELGHIYRVSQSASDSSKEQTGESDCMREAWERDA